ncbi:MAG: SPOR domain-containing protein [Bacteroidota bacterium]
MKSTLHILCLCAVVVGMCLPDVGLGQGNRGDGPDIQRRLELIERGQGESVKAELPTLMTNFQNHPGVLYLQAVLTTDGTEAAKIYQSIVDNFPSSEWADDALYRLYQYFYSIGLYKTGDQKMQQLKQNYPFSTYAATEPVPVPSPPPPQEQPAQVQSPSTVEKFPTMFTVQVGAFSTLQNAEELKAKFEKEDFSSNIFTMVQNGRKLHKVWVGEFQTYDDAKRFTGEIKRLFNLESIVVSR